MENVTKDQNKIIYQLFILKALTILLWEPVCLLADVKNPKLRQNKYKTS
jgi:hypothetical protein